MAESYEGFYSGGGSALSSEYGNLTGYKLHAGQLGFPGSPQTANQLGDTINAIKHGTKVFEVTMLQPDVGESIPKQHFEEMRALMKLTGVKPSVHGPLIDAAGFGEQGWTPTARADNERRLFDSIEKAQVLDPSGNLPVVIHASNGAPGTEWRPGDEKKGEDKFVMQRATMINQDTGQLQPISRDYQFQPGLDPTKSYREDAKSGKLIEVEDGKPGILMEAEGSIESANKSDWRNRMTEVAQMNKHAEEIIGGAYMHLDEYKNAIVVGQTKDGLEVKGVDEDGKPVDLSPIKYGTGQGASYDQMRKADLFLNNAELRFGTAFHHAYKYGTDRQKEELEKLSKSYEEKMGAVHPNMVFAPKKKKEILDNTLVALQEITTKRGKGDKNYGAPQVFKLSEDFAMDKAAKTFGNLAAKSYDKFGEKAPILAVENMYQGMAFSRAEDMRDLIKKSRENFAEQLIDGGMNKEKADKLARDKLGVTWDVGHLNMIRKTGFGEDEVVEQTKVITKDKSMVKHVHLTDNFGYADTHLVPGMGNVPFKKIMEQLEKTGRIDEMRKITEAGGLIQHFKKLPHSMTLAAMGSPIYGMTAAGSWGQAMDAQGAYFGGYGTLNPQTHHQYFGAGFTQMPVELGGQAAGGGSRFGGTPMA
ncbi:sugar phosphate isomerase/epimerase [Methanococcoides sp. SA1]|nr:sugar phosphate isomerase/epimerase [Methanococcoides sp. SA1]